MTAGTSPTISGGEKGKDLLEVPIRFASAWTENDAAGVAEMFVQDGVLIWPGVRRAGHTEIHEFLTTVFAESLRGSGMRGATVDTRFTTEDVALLRTHDAVRVPHPVEPREYLLRTTWICVRREGAWRLAGYQNTVRGAGAALPGG